MAEAKPVAERVEKIMSIRPGEFEAGIARLDTAASQTTSGGIARHVVDHPSAGDATVTITFEKLEPAVLGGLMRLPRARVVLEMADLAPDARRAFLGVFDQTFQRGGG